MQNFLTKERLEREARIRLNRRTYPRATIVRCKRCKTTKRTMTVYDGWHFYEVRFDGPTAPERIFGECPTCKTFRKIDLIDGTVNDSPCDDRCTSATGHKCECSCGGANHGLFHA